MKKALKKTVAVLCLVLIVSALCVFALAGCDEKPVYMEEDTFFALEGLKIGFLDNPEMINALIPVLKMLQILTPDTGMTLYADGTFDLVIEMAEDSANMLNTMLSSFGISFDGLSDFDLEHYATLYAAPLFPGFTLSDMKSSLDLVKNSVGFELLLDYSDPKVVKLINSLETTGHLNSDFEIPDQFGLKLHGIYEIRKVKAVDANGMETEYTAVQLGKMPDSGEPFLTFTMRTNEDGKRRLDLRVEFLKLDLSFLEP